MRHGGRRTRPPGWRGRARPRLCDQRAGPVRGRRDGFPGPHGPGVAPDRDRPPLRAGQAARPAGDVRGGVLTRAMFVLYLVVIAAGLVCFIAIGLLGQQEVRDAAVRQAQRARALLRLDLPRCAGWTGAGRPRGVQPRPGRARERDGLAVALRALVGLRGRRAGELAVGVPPVHALHRRDRLAAQQAIAGRVAYNAQQLSHREAPLSLLQYLGSSDFWDRTLQNWQSEFLAVGSMVVLANYLRQRGSLESKPVGAPHDVAEQGLPSSSCPACAGPRAHAGR